ncbi:hypothetical protein [Sorangium sp. So ce861]|uniref:hypothetical protein n=1 Tax=Sorangium sp. So ce861 TaxID=3133323 RepID=UPI003F647A39
MGDRLIERDRGGRLRVNLFRLPRWAQVLVALAVVGVVVAVARSVDPDPATPRWLTDAIRIGGWVYLALAAVAVASWLRRRRDR